jgi:hypothetical protein
MGSAIDSQRQTLVPRGCDLDDVQVSRLPLVRYFCRGVESRMEDANRVVQDELVASIFRDLLRLPRRCAVGANIERHVGVDAEILSLRIRRRKTRWNHSLTGDLLPCASICQVNRAFELRHPELRQVGIRRSVLSKVALGSCTFQYERTDSHNPVSASDSLGGIVHDLHFWRCLRTADGETPYEHEPKNPLHRALLV